MSDEPSWNSPDSAPPNWGQPPATPGQPPPGPVTGSWAPNPQQPAAGAWQQPPPAAAAWQPPPPAAAWQPPPPAAAAWQPMNQPASARPTNTLAILSLVLALVFSPIGLVLGFVARKQARERNEGGAGLATAALVIGIIGTFVLLLICIGDIGNA